MATHSIQSNSPVQVTFPASLNFVRKFNDFADSQQKWAIAYFIGSLMLIGSFFLPVTFLMVYSLNGPVIPFLGISMISFFVSLIANMSGMGIRACLYSFFFSILLHLGMMLSAFAGFYF
ncbi:hypothetical protein GZH53_14445 [Flavihumibacter sp. R14]|nr:hypothetical protein [Flavihumibacter soli]